MGKYGVKMTDPGCVCRGYRFKPSPAVNACEKADCARCGFHFAENPLDCVAQGTGMVLENSDKLYDVLSDDSPRY